MLRPLKIVVNAGNGCAGPVIDLLEQQLPFDIIKIHHEPDGTFPNGIPNPCCRRTATPPAMRCWRTGPALGIAWDGDFDRCFFFDEHGDFIEGYYIVGLLAEAFLARHPGAKIIHDPRLTWNTIDIVRASRRDAGDEQDRPRLYQGADAGRGRGLRRRDERPSLLPRIRLLRQRHDPLAAGDRS